MVASVPLFGFFSHVPVHIFCPYSIVMYSVYTFFNVHRLLCALFLVSRYVACTCHLPAVVFLDDSLV